MIILIDIGLNDFNMDKIKGLTSKQVEKKRSLGLSNTVIDSYSPSYLKIILKNLFSLINIVIFPLLVALATFELYRDIFAFSTFLVVNTVISALDEIRIKRTLDKLKSQFQLTALVIRDGNEVTLPVSEVVQEDVIKANEGESIIADGEIISENYLQVDDSMLTGESNYIRKHEGEKVLSGSFIITGSCYYKVLSVGKSNYLNTLGSEASKYKENKSPLQNNSDKLITFLVVASLFCGALVYGASQYLGTSQQDSLLELTTVISLIIPQTLIFLFTLSFTISITKLYRKGVLVQKGGSIEDLSNVSAICLDKTGTITTNEMKIKDVQYFNLKEDAFGIFYNSVKAKLVGVNKTQEVINKYYKSFDKKDISNFDQVPFTSKQKFSQVMGSLGKKRIILTLGAPSVLLSNLEPEQKKKLQKLITEKEQEGFRVLIGLYYEDKDSKVSAEKPLNFKTDKAVMFVIEETLNPGIGDLLKSFSDQGIKVKIISGDSRISVTRIVQKLGLDVNQVVDLSEIDTSADENNQELIDLVLSKSIFTRAKPEDKLKIINILKNHGEAVAMVGDGINDVLALKAANVSIAMESGAKIARDVADIVLLNNDYQKIPEIFYEGDNILFNLKLSTKMFLVKSFFAIFLSLFFVAIRKNIPISPSSTLIFSFLGTSAPSYVIIFTRQKIKEKIPFFRDVLMSAVPMSFIFFLLVGVMFLMFDSIGISKDKINTGLIIFILSISLIYSIYLLWEAEKLRGLFSSIFIYIILVAVGIYQTILPLNFNEDPRRIVVALLAIAAFGIVLIGGFLKLVVNLKMKQLTLVLLVLSLVFGVAMVLPFRDYYNVTRIPLEMIIQIFIMSVVALVSIFGLGKITRRFLTLNS